MHAQEGDPEGWWEETFNGHQDSKPSGPEAISIDITFPGYKHVYGIPERATNFSLQPTAGTQLQKRTPTLLLISSCSGFPLPCHGPVWPETVSICVKQCQTVSFSRPCHLFHAMSCHVMHTLPVERCFDPAACLLHGLMLHQSSVSLSATAPLHICCCRVWSAVGAVSPL